MCSWSRAGTVIVHHGGGHGKQSREEVISGAGSGKLS
jgi:hypothetical protein